MSRKKCVCVLPRSVFPTVSGYALKNKNLIELLGRTYDLTLAVIKEEPFTEEELSFYESHSKAFLPCVRSRAKCALGSLSAFLRGKPLQVGYYTDKKLKRQLAAPLAAADVAVAVLERTVAYLDAAPADTVRVFDMVDSIGLNYEHSKESTTSPLWKLLYTVEGRRLLAYEKEAVSTSDVTYLFNPAEADYWRASGNVKWLPHGVKPELLTYEKTDPAYASSVAFIGKMDYQPNVDAVLWYLQNVHPLTGDEIPFVIVGTNPAREVLSAAEKAKNVTVTGYLKDPYLILRSCLALVAPMQTGGGIQNKVLEGMTLGKINVISPLAASPIRGAKDGTHFLVADTPRDYARLLTDIKENPERYQSIGPAARALIAETFTWEAYGRLYLEGIAEAEGNKRKKQNA